MNCGTAQCLSSVVSDFVLQISHIAHRVQTKETERKRKRKEREYQYAECFSFKVSCKLYPPWALNISDGVSFVCWEDYKIPARLIVADAQRLRRGGWEAGWCHEDVVKLRRLLSHAEEMNNIQQLSWESEERRKTMCVKYITIHSH